MTKAYLEEKRQVYRARCSAAPLQGSKGGRIMLETDSRRTLDSPPKVSTHTALLGHLLDRLRIWYVEHLRESIAAINALPN
jgi:hypothetical protein